MMKNRRTERPAFFRAVLVASLALLVAVPPVLAQSSGLNNSSKKFTRPIDMKPGDIADPAQIVRTWDAAIVQVPLPEGGSLWTDFDALERQYGDGTKKFATVIYLHGCSGFWQGTFARVKFLADNGYLVIAPASLARTKYPKSCNRKSRAGGYYRKTLKMRQLDAGHAIERARALPYVDGDNIFLMGFSQGGVTTATFEPANPRQRVTARVIEGWTCMAGWPEYKGVRAPAGEPVLAMVGAKDPWFDSAWTRGDCTLALDGRKNSKSIVYRDGSLATVHSLLDHAAPQAAVLAFLARHVAGR